VLDDLSDDESALVDAARDGTPLVRDDRTSIRAELIRELLLGRHGELDPRGVRLHGATVKGALDLAYVTAKVGLDLIECVIEEPMGLSHATLPRLVLEGSRIGGIQATGLQVASNMSLEEAVVSGTGETGAVYLWDAHIGGRLTMARAEVRNDSGPALNADRLRVDGILFLREARMSGNDGVVRLPAARIGALDMKDVELHNSRGPALNGADLKVERNILLSRAVLSGYGDSGAVRLTGAHIGGQLLMDGADIENPSGPALLADGFTVDGALLIEHARLSGTGDLGAIRLASARVGKDIYVVDTQVHNDSGPALHADGVRIDDTIVLMRSRISGAGDGGSIWLLGAHVGGIRIVETEVHDDCGSALFADQVQVKGHVFLERVRMSGAGDHAAIRLAVARVDGQFAVKGVTVANQAGQALDLVHDPTGCERSHLVDVNDFGFGSLTGVDWRQWLHLIRCHTREYRPSPYQQLAAVERAAGHDGNARHILIAQQEDLRHRAPKSLGGWLTRRFHWLWGVLAGYGYRARRTALALLIALAAAGLVAVWAGNVTTGPGRHAAEHTITSAAPRTPCTTVELVGLGLDRGLPLGPTGLRTRCDLDTETTPGQVFTVLLWIVQAAVWGLATLCLAGYTGLIRKTA
jgi:hypothetical protein